MRIISCSVLAALMVMAIPRESEAGNVYWTVPKPTPAPDRSGAPGPGSGQNQPLTQPGNGQAGAATPAPLGDLQGIGFGVAIGVTDYPENNVVSTAVQNNVLRLTDGGRSDIGFWLEMHHFWGLGTPEQAPAGTQIQSESGVIKAKVYSQGWGPFVAVQLGTDEKVIQAVGIGLMWGVRLREGSDTSINFGIGYSAHQISVLTKGLALDQPLPAGITSATTKNKIVAAPMIITSFSF
jgi:hypothetical protein